MILLPLILDFILFVIGFGVGFWLLITAIEQEPKWLKISGSIFGWILIVMAIIISLFSCYYSIKFARTGYMTGGCPMYNMHKMMMQQRY